MKHLSIDIETRSQVDLKTCGVYKYAQSCEIILFAYSVDLSEEVKVLDLLHGDKIPDDIMYALTDPNVIKHAYNAQFERVVIGTVLFGKPLDASQWRCTYIYSLYLALPSTLDRLSKFMWPSKVDMQKDSRGKRLLRKFSIMQDKKDVPADSQDWLDFIEYNRQDVYVEVMIYKVLQRVEPNYPQLEQRLWELDQKINDAGVGVDMNFVVSALKLAEEVNDRELEEFKNITGLEKHTQNVAFARWLTEQTGITCNSVAKEELSEYTKKLIVIPDNVYKAITIRQLLSKSSLAKYKAIINSAYKNRNGEYRTHGLFQFYGASRTGRFAGRLVQVQNLPRNYISHLSDWRDNVKLRDLFILDQFTDNVPDILSQLIRTAFIPSKGNEFVISDFHAIEAVVSAWLAGESWRLDVFRGHGKIYEASASQMFGVPIDSITTPDGEHGPNYALRAKGKVAELALGYGGGVGALSKMGGEKLGLSIPEMESIRDKWRKRSPHIVSFWAKLDNAFKLIIKERNDHLSIDGKIRVVRQRNFIAVVLPSGRKLYYFKPGIETKDEQTGFTRQMYYYGQDQTTGKWGRIYTRGSKIFENIVQAISRDILCNAMLNLDKRGFKIVMHVHDEIIVDVPKNLLSVDVMNSIMTDLPEWGKDIPLTAAGFKAEFYQKD